MVVFIMLVAQLRGIINILILKTGFLIKYIMIEKKLILILIIYNIIHTLIEAIHIYIDM